MRKSRRLSRDSGRPEGKDDPSYVAAGETPVPSRPEPGTGARLPMLVSFGAALLTSVVVAGATNPPQLFLKYVVAARLSPEKLAPRLFDFSPLYLAVCRALIPPWGDGIVLWLQCLLHALMAVAVAFMVTRLAGRKWGFAGGLLTALHRPLLVYSSLHEPEIVLLAVLTAAILLGMIARERLRQPADRPAGWGTWLALAGAGAAIGLATLARPTYVLLMPVWAWWVAAGGDRGRPLWRMRILVLAAACLVVGPVVLSRSIKAGFPVLMNPGPLFYEGNSPMGRGLTRAAPTVVELVELKHSEPDYGHVAYRRVAEEVLKQPGSFQQSNQYWTRLGMETVKDSPFRWLGLFLGKIPLILMPYEAHDLSCSEMMDRRVRAWFPWGFNLLLLSLPWLLWARRERLSALAGPLALLVLSVFSEALFYSTARYRLPLQLSMLIIAPVLARDLLTKTAGRRRAIWLPLLAGLLLWGLLAGSTGWVGVADQIRANYDIKAPARETPGETLSAFFDGRSWPTTKQQAVTRLEQARTLLRSRNAQLAIAELAPICGKGLDLTASEYLHFPIPDYWLALAKLRLNDRAGALRAARVAAAIRPNHPAFDALVFRLEHPDDFPARARNWRPRGCDPVSAQWALACAAMFDRDLPAARAIVQPLLVPFPELGGIIPGAGTPYVDTPGAP